MKCSVKKITGKKLKKPAKSQALSAPKSVRAILGKKLPGANVMTGKYLTTKSLRHIA